MQTPAGRIDGNIDTSDGIFVFTGVAPAVAVGDLVDVAGQVNRVLRLHRDHGGGRDAATGSGTVPRPVSFDCPVPSPNPTISSCAIEFECYEGMLVEIARWGRSRVRTSASALIRSPRFTSRPHRRAPSASRASSSRVLPVYPEWDGNPEVFELDPDKLGCRTLVSIPAGSSFSAIGVLGFEFGGYELWPAVLDISPAPLPVPVRPRDPGEFTVGSLNVFRLFDDIDDPATATATITCDQPTEYARRLDEVCLLCQRSAACAGCPGRTGSREPQGSAGSGDRDCRSRSRSRVQRLPRGRQRHRNDRRRIPDARASFRSTPSPRSIRT